MIVVPRFAGHEDCAAHTKKLKELQEDIAKMVSCVKNIADAQEGKPKRVRGGFKAHKHKKGKPNRVKGGFKALKHFVPIHFQDLSCRLRRQAWIHDMVKRQMRK